MTAQKIFNTGARKDLTDILFEHRNKAYGAYELRKHYDERMNKSMLITLGIFVLFFFSAFIFTSVQNPIWKLSAIPGKPFISTTNVKLPDIKTPPSIKKPPLKPVDTKINPNNTNYNIVKQMPIPLKPDSDIVIPQKDPGLKGIGTAGTDGNSNTQGQQSTTGTTIPTETKEAPVVKYAEVMPQFPGGENALMKYLQKNIKYTAAAKNAHAEGQIFITFVVNTDGSIEGVKVKQDEMGYGCAQNAMDVISDMPHWLPGSSGNYPVRVEMVLPISYKLE